MKILFDNEKECDLSSGIDISIPLNFNGPQPNAYGVEPARSEPVRSDSLVGDTRQGGSCNFEQYTFIPHCTGTHTECVGHITNKRISVRDCLKDAFIPAVLISIEPYAARSETYAVDIGPDDLVITRRSIEAAISLNELRSDAASGIALIIRTLPNDKSKLTRSYAGDKMPPYFTTEAIRYIVELGYKHLLVDLPSIDRLFDEGRLSNHRIFWNIEEGSFEAGPGARMENTVTELIYVPDAVPDGEYLLNLQIAPFASDASPARPLLFPIS